MPPRTVRPPRPLATAALTTAVAAVLCFVPLFDLLGYESSAAMAAVLGLAVMVRTSWLFDQGWLLPPLADDPRSAGRRRGPLADFAALLPAHLALAVPPLLLLLANALRVKNCDPVVGLQFWLVLPVVSIVAGQALGFVTGVLPRFRVAAGLLIVLAQTGAFLRRLAWHPPIAGHTWTIGWFAGSIYDEALALPAHLLWARLGVLVGSGLLVLGLQAAFEARTGRRHGPTWAALALFLAGTATLHVQRQELGIQHDTESVQGALGGRIETEHFVIWHGAGRLDEEERRLIAEDHEYRYAELQAFFGTDPVAWRGRPIESFVYPDPATKYRLMRSRRTLVARPWTHQMHISWDGYGDHALAHELAHLFTAEFGGGPLQLATRGGLFPDLGMVEGVAVAADARPDELSLHQAARAMRARDIAPDLDVLLGPGGFWTQPGSRAYTLVGSFVQFLVDRHGIAPFREVYGEGDWEAAYGVPLARLVGEWEAFVDAVPLSEAQEELAAYRYRRGSIFQRVCARTIAELRRRAGAAEARGDLDTALLLREQIRDLEPGNREHRLALAELRARRGEVQAAAAILDRLLGSDEVAGQARLRVLEEKADLLWREGRTAEAAALYADCRVPGQEEGRHRSLVVKGRGTGTAVAEAEARARTYLLDREISGATRLWTALMWAEADRDDPVPRYLVGRVLLSHRQYLDAAGWLSSPVDDVLVDDERRRLQAEAWLHAGQLELAELAFTRLAADTGSSRIRALAEEGAARARWKRTGGL